jgi:hypothetical protein
VRKPGRLQWLLKFHLGCPVNKEKDDSNEISKEENLSTIQSWDLENVKKPDQKNESFLVQTAVGVVVKCFLLAAVNVVPPITDQGDLIKKLSIRKFD